LLTLIPAAARSTNVSVQHSANRVDPQSLNSPAHEEKAPAPIDPSIDKWFYISGASA
jgi:inorganic pyrophosphatase